MNASLTFNAPYLLREKHPMREIILFLLLLPFLPFVWMLNLAVATSSAIRFRKARADQPQMGGAKR